MRLGIWTPAPLSIRPDGPVKSAFERLTQHGGGIDGNFQYAVEVLQRAEQLGFEITLVAQRFLGPDLDSWIFAAALTGHLQTMEIMAAVHPGIMDPRIAAKMGASIDRISGGRFCVNIVNGGRPQEFAVFGEWLERSEARYNRMHEFIKVLRGMWTEEDFNFRGQFYTIEHGTVPTKSVRTPHPPIYAASRVDDGMNVVAQECDTWFVNYNKDFRLYDESLKTIEREVDIMERRCAELGRRMRYGMNACIIIGDTDVEARAIAQDYLAEIERDPSIATASGGLGANIIGSVSTVVDRIRTYRSLGVELFMMQFYPMRQGLEIFAERVMPELVSLGEIPLPSAPLQRRAV